MKKPRCKNVITFIVLIFMLACTVLPCLAYVITPYLSENHYGFDYSIPSGQTEWNGKEKDKIWDLDFVNGKECRFNVSILSTRYVSLTADLKKVNTLWFDTTVLSLTVSSSDTWKGELFNPEKSHGYYAKITATSDIGCNGRTSITLP